jgi:hypothetical protein
MTSRPTIALLLLSFWSFPGAAQAEPSEFSSYDECILESLKGVSSDVAANAIITSCRNKFPENVPVAAEPAESPPEQETVQPEETEPEVKPAIVAAGASRELTKEELSKLKATLLGFTTQYRITFENMNEDITITEVTIAVWDDLDPRGLKTYTETMNIPPSELAKVTYEVIYMGDDQGWRWKIDSARGVPSIH